MPASSTRSPEAAKMGNIDILAHFIEHQELNLKIKDSSGHTAIYLLDTDRGS